MSETTIVVFALAVIAVLINWKSLRDLERAGEKPWLMLGGGALLLWYIFMDDFILPVILLAAFLPWLILRKLGKRGNRIYFTGLGIIAAITAIYFFLLIWSDSWGLGEALLFFLCTFVEVLIFIVVALVYRNNHREQDQSAS